ncbi:MAG TPA: hypothetical protein PLV45_16300 [bacterium]|nr:hypothetical protein [bacterium]
MKRMKQYRICTMPTAFSVLLLSVLWVASGSVMAQEPAPPAAETQAETGEMAEIPKAPTPVPEEEQKFIYNSQGMRDPFVSLLIDNRLDPGKAGLGAMKISEIKLQGIQIGLGKVAIVLGTDGKAYSMEVGQSLLDGKCVAIEGRKVVFEKVILDPFGREKDKQTIELYLH